MAALSFRKAVDLATALVVAFAVPAWGASEPQNVNFGPMRAMVIENVKGAPYVVYLHGFGQIGNTSYQALKSEIDTNAALQKVNWIFPDSPHGEWFAITAVDSVGNPNEDMWMSTLKTARSDLDKMVKAAKLDPRKIIWAGFSEGAITAADYVLHAKVPALGLIVNSGAYFNSTDWKRGSPQLKGIRFYMSHDRRDETLPFSEAKKLEKLLLANGLIGKLQTHSEYHAIPQGFMSKSVKDLLSNCENLMVRKKQKE